MAALTDVLRNKIIDWYHRGEDFTPPTSLWVALVTSVGTAAAPGSEVSTSGTGYGRVEIPADLLTWAGTQAALSTAVSSGTSGATSNNGAVNFGSAVTPWGTVAGFELWTEETGGERHIYGTIVDGSGVPAPRSIGALDPVSFPASALRVVWG